MKVIIAGAVVLLGIGYTMGISAAVGYGRFTKQSTWIIDADAERVMSRVEVIRDGQSPPTQDGCYAVYRWFTGTGGATLLGRVACDASGVVYPASR